MLCMYVCVYMYTRTHIYSAAVTIQDLALRRCWGARLWDGAGAHAQEHHAAVKSINARARAAMRSHAREHHGVRSIKERCRVVLQWGGACRVHQQPRLVSLRVAAAGPAAYMYVRIHIYIDIYI